MNHLYIACDLGAESGRVIAGHLTGGRLTIEEMHRFPTGAQHIGDTLHWDMNTLWSEIKVGLSKAAQIQRVPGATASVSADSWGVDYVLMHAGEPLSKLPYHYRDDRVDEPFKRIRESESARLVFEETGLQFLSFNTLYQLVAEEGASGAWQKADQFLLIADYVLYLLSGVAQAEVSLASTTQMYNPRERVWSGQLQRGFGLKEELFPPLTASGTILGPMTQDVAGETGLAHTQVVATCSHDTGAAVAAVPAGGDNWAYLSSGTWSLLGVELPAPIINDQVRAAGFTNEVGVGHRIRFLKNIVGLWVLQECQRAWASEGQQFSYGELAQVAEDAEPFRSLIHPAAERFAAPGEMPQKIAAYCRETGQLPPQTIGQYTRCILESLALLYHATLEDAQTLTGKTVNRLHIVGGGGQNALLNQFAANATEKTVVVGPVEATAVGNLLIQAVALGHLQDWDALRRTVRDSFPTQTFTPQHTTLWRAAYARFTQLNLLT